MRSTLRAMLLALPLFLSHALGQTEVDDLRMQIEHGGWHSAAFVSGPALVARYPNERAAHYLLARALLLAGEVNAAAEALARADGLASGGIPAEHHHLHGLILAQQGEALAGAERLRTAFSLQPHYRYAMDWGRVAWQGGDWAGAEAAFLAAGQTDDGLVEAWPALARGRLLAAQGRNEEAVRAYLTALHRYEAQETGEPRLPGPAYVEAWYRLGVTYEALALLDQAISAYRTARSIDPNHGPSVLAFDRLSRRGD
jgi:tetratricopeptide (TPR) repeat protein